MTKPTKWHVRPAKTQISLVICTVWSESLLCAHWEAKNPRFLHVNSEDCDQNVQMPRLIWVFTGRACHFVGFGMKWLIFIWKLGAVAGSEASLLGMQAASSLSPMSGTFFCGDLVMKTFLRPFSLFRWFKKSSCQLLAKEPALSNCKLPRRLAQEQCS